MFGRTLFFRKESLENIIKRPDIFPFDSAFELEEDKNSKLNARRTFIVHDPLPNINAHKDDPRTLGHTGGWYPRGRVRTEGGNGHTHGTSKRFREVVMLDLRRFEPRRRVARIALG